MKKLNLDALDATGKTVEVAGTEYAVRKMTARVAFIVEAAVNTDDGIAKLHGYCDAVQALVPTMPRDTLEDLSPEQMLAIIQHAGREVEAVQEAAADPKASGSAMPPVVELQSAISSAAS